MQSFLDMNVYSVGEFQYTSVRGRDMGRQYEEAEELEPMGEMHWSPLMWGSVSIYLHSFPTADICGR